MSELLDFVIVSMVLVAIGIYGLVVKRNAIRMLFSIEIIANAAKPLACSIFKGPAKCTRASGCPLLDSHSCGGGRGSWAYYSSIQAIQRD